MCPDSEHQNPRLEMQMTGTPVLNAGTLVKLTSKDIMTLGTFLVAADCGDKWDVVASCWTIRLLDRTERPHA